jgi:hypothetical protein
MNRCHICAEDVGHDYCSDPRSNDAPNNFGLVLHEECAVNVYALTDADYLAIAEQGPCPECDRFDAPHEGVCAGPGEPGPIVDMNANRRSPMIDRVSGRFSGEPTMPTNEDIANVLAAMIDPQADSGIREDARDELETWCTGAEVDTYSGAGVRTSEAGFVLRIGDTEFQITVQSRPRCQRTP